MVESQHELDKGRKAPPARFSQWLILWSYPTLPHSPLTRIILLRLDWQKRNLRICICIFSCSVNRQHTSAFLHSLALSFYTTSLILMLTHTLTHTHTYTQRKTERDVFTVSLNKSLEYPKILRLCSQSFRRKPHSFTRIYSNFPTGGWGWNKLASTSVHIVTSLKLLKQKSRMSKRRTISCKFMKHNALNWVKFVLFLQLSLWYSLSE